MTPGHRRCTQGRPYSPLSPLCSSFTGSQSPGCWIRQQSSKIRTGHCAFETSGLTFRFTFVMVSCVHHAHPTFLTFALQCHPGDNTPQCPFLRELGCALPQTCCVTSHLTLWSRGFLISTMRGLAVDYLISPDSGTGGSMSHPSSIPRDRHLMQRTLEEKLTTLFSIYQMFAECLCLIL